MKYPYFWCSGVGQLTMKGRHRKQDVVFMSIALPPTDHTVTHHFTHTQYNVWVTRNKRMRVPLCKRSEACKFSLPDPVSIPQLSQLYIVYTIEEMQRQKRSSMFFFKHRHLNNEPKRGTKQQEYRGTLKSIMDQPYPTITHVRCEW